ncbi:tRNA uridine-5-carboxymethylaminomethyl(34) synthesis GTPase MnmE [Chitinophaga pendula]|uniref:tRNA uridine-5-carboxymethylaminomethyl(34) synthesis GTPase MnmE n=1 Tax=Chitinophaga TaxID=79328 RepID=UPI000BAEA19B|nr:MULTISPECIES: tRNA uridine-5-carboxymethylaminomethyl(34) synthesis GTPase MnmE [Chitinophaga]ASZ10981.1 tRNA uridine-5-carboxymethylaminomethyl(34) synthesis GTPase MnmE [Chitinophaga sp. MD30]UCJ06029.1 tRNA uridine-5-carboxymethylaminomethyl(34) synthesis GTPase MnmE [Chitinophaga pendula]
MLGKLTGHDDTIAAIATAPGIGAIAVIRLSGPKAIAICNSLFPSKDLEIQPGHTLHFGSIVSNGRIIDEVVVSLYKAPRSYTGEEVVEVSCHGSPYIQQQLLDAFVLAGARLARAGEFTQRAFLNGKLDLTQAESVADLIASNSAASHQTAMQQMRGGFSRELKTLREQLITFSALIELELDFSQEDVEFADRTRLYELVDNATVLVRHLVNSFSMGNVIKNGVNTAIVGKPNAGKSTLLNTLLNENRAIVSDIAGTTRDTIEEILNIDGILFRLIDTAGIRESTDTIESIGVQKTLEKIREAGVVVYLFDVNELTEDELLGQINAFSSQGVNHLLVGNKTDIQGEENIRKKFATIPDILFISAKNHAHIDQLKQQLVAKVISGSIQTEDTIITNARHHSALQEVLQSLYAVKGGMENQLPGDLLALDIRRSLHYLGEITGEVTNEDRLDFIFSKFCIGK